MKKKFIKATENDVIGSSFAGYVLFTYRQLRKRLGPPKDLAGLRDGKIRAEWMFKTIGRKPTVITVYDYKEIIPVRDVKLWHVGMKGDSKILERFLKEKLDYSVEL